MTAGALTILHLAANRWWTGSPDPTIQLASAQQARGHRVLLAVPPGDRFEAKAREAGLTLLEGFHLRARLAPLQIARDAGRLRRVAREQAVDVLHAHHSHDHWLALLARPRSGGGGAPGGPPLPPPPGGEGRPGVRPALPPPGAPPPPFPPHRGARPRP